jgi:16S rRNA (guanine527-N7)-methyltransferase
VSSATEQVLVTGAERLGLTLSATALRAFEIYTRELMEWSARLNLTGHRGRREIEIYHYLDSLSLFQTGHLTPGREILDVGSGAGFPGLPLRIVEPSLGVTLIEASRKKAVFLRHLLRSLGIEDVAVVTGRAEDRAREHGAAYDIVLSRAVAGMEKVCTWSAPLLREGGLFLFQKSRGVAEELRSTGAALAEAGLSVREVLSLEVPYLERSRSVVIIEKTRP